MPNRPHWRLVALGLAAGLPVIEGCDGEAPVQGPRLTEPAGGGTRTPGMPGSTPIPVFKRPPVIQRQAIPPAQPPTLAQLGDESCPQLACLPCSRGEQCAESESFIEGTCCALGDNLVQLGSEIGSELVDIEVDDRFAYACGGFGARIYDITDATSPARVGHASPRCQRIGLGTHLDNGDRVLYLAHHGDTWVDGPFLATYHVPADSSREPGGPQPVQVDLIEDREVLFEGLLYHQGYLYAAAHAGGIHVYATDERGVPTHLRTLTGLGNAWKLAAQGETAYVADTELGLGVLSLDDPESPALVATVETLGDPRDVAVSEGRVYVALGGAGVDIFDIADPRQPERIGNFSGRGSAQAVSANESYVAVANWSRVELRAAADFRLLATERTRASFEQDLGVVLRDDQLYVAEWEGLHVLGYRPGFVAADLVIDEDVFTLPTQGPSARAVVVRNAGLAPLHLSGLRVERSDGEVPERVEEFEFDVTQLTVPPGARDFFQFTLLEPAEVLAGAPSVRLWLSAQSNDPDAFQANLAIPLSLADYGISIGDPLTDEFAFLDPSGARQLDSLRGQVTMLAYFALF